MLRTASGSLTSIINFTVTKFLSLTLIAVVNNMGPPITIVFCYVFLKEKIPCFEAILLSITIAGIMTYAVAGAAEKEDGKDKDDEGMDPTLHAVMLICLALNPLLSSGSVIAMRKMKKFHESIVALYLALGVGFTSLTMTLILGDGFAPIANFDFASWVLIILCGCLSTSTNTLRFMALKLQKASALQKLAPLTTLWQVFFDLFLFDASFNPVQWIGLTILFGVYVFQGMKFLIWDAPRQKKRDALKLLEVERMNDAIKELHSKLSDKYNS